MVDTDEVIADVELHLQNEWYLSNARERRRERARRQQPQPALQPAPQPSLALCYLLVSVALMALSAAILAVWG